MLVSGRDLQQPLTALHGSMMATTAIIVVGRAVTTGSNGGGCLQCGKHQKGSDESSDHGSTRSGLFRA